MGERTYPIGVLKVNEPLKTGTTNVGIVCSDGIVLAADNRATMGYYVAGKDLTKIFKLNDKIAVTVAGSVSDIMMVIKLVKAEMALKENQSSRAIRIKEAANLLTSMCYNAFRRQYAIAAFLLGGYDDEGFHLINIEPAGSMMEKKDYDVSGSGMMYAVGVLESKYKKGISTAEGVELAKEAMNAALQRDIGSGNGMDIWVVTKDGVQEAFKTTTNPGL